MKPVKIIDSKVLENLDFNQLVTEMLKYMVIVFNQVKVLTRSICEKKSFEQLIYMS